MTENKIDKQKKSINVKETLLKTKLIRKETRDTKKQVKKTLVNLKSIKKHKIPKKKVKKTLLKTKSMTKETQNVKKGKKTLLKTKMMT